MSDLSKNKEWSSAGEEDTVMNTTSTPKGTFNNQHHNLHFPHTLAHTHTTQCTCNVSKQKLPMRASQIVWKACDAHLLEDTEKLNLRREDGKVRASHAVFPQLPEKS